MHACMHIKVTSCRNRPRIQVFPLGEGRKDPGYEVAVEICVKQLVYARLNSGFHTQEIYI
jgi:hypothetical protein